MNHSRSPESSKYIYKWDVAAVEAEAEEIQQDVVIKAIVRQEDAIKETPTTGYQ
jgi:hypothetical protein